MLTMNVRQFRRALPQLEETLAREHELVLVSNGAPLARILPAKKVPVLQPLAAFRDSLSAAVLPDSTPEIRAERDLR